jgi:hypothetical protein
MKPPNISHPDSVYIARARCGCVTNVINDDHDKDTAALVSEVIRRGLTVTSVSWLDYRNKVSQEATFLKCQHSCQGDPLQPSLF